MDVRETELFEPTRGSGAEVSMLIEAIDDRWSVSIEIGDGLRIERFQRHRRCTREMLLHEDGIGKYVHEFCAATHHPLGLQGIDPLGHCPQPPRQRGIKLWTETCAKLGVDNGTGIDLYELRITDTLPG